MAALKVVVERYPDARMANPPAWVTEGSWAGIRINQLSANDLLGENIPPFGLKDHIKDVVLSALTELVPEMLSSPAFDKPSMEESLSFEGDVTLDTSVSCFLFPVVTGFRAYSLAKCL